MDSAARLLAGVVTGPLPPPSAALEATLEARVAHYRNRATARDAPLLADLPVTNRGPADASLFVTAAASHLQPPAAAAAAAVDADEDAGVAEFKAGADTDGDDDAATIMTQDAAQAAITAEQSATAIPLRATPHETVKQLRLRLKLYGVQPLPRRKDDILGRLALVETEAARMAHIIADADFEPLQDMTVESMKALMLGLGQGAPDVPADALRDRLRRAVMLWTDREEDTAE